MKYLSLHLVLLLNISFQIKAQVADSIAFEKGYKLAQQGSYAEAKPLLIKVTGNDTKVTIKQKGQAYFYLMRIFWDQGDFGAALQYGDTARNMFDQVKDSYWHGFTFYDMSMKNLITGSYDIALTQAQEAYDQFLMERDTTMMIRSLTRRGIVFHDIEEYTEGLRVCDQAKVLYDQFSEAPVSLLEPILGIKAINYDDDGESSKAVELYLEILSFKDHLSEKAITRTYNNMGNSLMKIGRLKEANEYFLLNLETNLRNDFKYGIATVKTNLGTVAYMQGNFLSAATYLTEAEKIAYEINDAEKILDVLQQQHLYFEVLGTPKKSLAYLKRYHAVKDSLYDLDKQRQIRFLEITFETEKKEQQIAIQSSRLAEQEADLRRKQTLLISTLLVIGFLILTGFLWRNRLKKKQYIQLQREKINAREAEINATISSQEKERARYARDLHDGFGQMISILNMNLANLKDGASPNERQQVFDQSEQVINEMYEELKSICFDLMPQTLISQGLESAIQEYANRINSAGKIFVETNFFGLEKRPDEIQEISLYRISQEWINNILKYSDARKITLQITQDQEEFTLLIEDDGLGFDKQELINGTGNGWRNLNTRTNLIQGQLELETQADRKGTTLIVNAPVLLAKREEMVKMAN